MTTLPDRPRHVVLAKPGDMLLIGNIGHIGDPDRASEAVQFFKDFGIRVVFFADDIDIAKLPEGDL